jgi:hypothetical protein
MPDLLDLISLDFHGPSPVLAVRNILPLVLNRLILLSLGLVLRKWDRVALSAPVMPVVPSCQAHIAELMSTAAYHVVASFTFFDE